MSKALFFMLISLSLNKAKIVPRCLSNIYSAYLVYSN